MKTHEFLEAVLARLPAFLPTDYAGFDSRIAFSFVQVWYGDPRVHFECWLQHRTGRLEIGLHLEGRRDFSYGLAALLAERMLDIVMALGEDVELEEWTGQWTRLHETTAVSALGADLADEAAQRLADYIEVLRPMLDSAMVGAVASEITN